LASLYFFALFVLWIGLELDNLPAIVNTSRRKNPEIKPFGRLQKVTG
jgi:hypothetical protein